MAVYHRHMTQRVPSDPNWTVNCTAYCGAMLADDSVLGGMLGITGKLIRAKSSEPNPDPGSPGLNIAQVRSVLTGLRIATQDMTGNPRGDVLDAIEEGRRVLLQIAYRGLGGRRCQADGDFGHAVVLVKIAGDGDLWASDPLCDRAKKYPREAIFDAAQEFARDTGVASGLRWLMTRKIQRVA